MKCLLNSFNLFSMQFISEINAEIISTLDLLNEKYPELHIWWGALSTTFLISVIPYLILYLIPLKNTPEYESQLKICLSLAAGGLLGDAFLHLIPEALIVNRAVNPNHSQMIGLWILGGFIGFFVVEKCVRIVKNYCQQEIDCDLSDKHNISLDSKHNNNFNGFDNHLNCYSNEQKSNQFLSGFKDIKIAGYLNLVADLVHNFTDGLAIGSSFISGHSVGIVTGIAIMVHEIPHEIGDYAVLLKSGCSPKRAMSLQLLTAVGALTGTVVSLVMGTSGDESGYWVLPFTGGGFIYIGTVTILPELTDQSDLKQSAKELFALLFGIFVMTLIL